MGKFNEILKNLRTSNGYTQDELSKRMGVSRSTIGMYENGSREPDFETLEIIADFFNVDINYLLGRTLKTTYIPHQANCFDNVLSDYDIDTLHKLNNDNIAKVNTYAKNLYTIQQMEAEPTLMAAHHDNPTTAQQELIMKDMELLKKPSNK